MMERVINSCLVKDKRVLVRADLNLPVINQIIVDDSRLVSLIPTINCVFSGGGRAIIISHFGRPKSGYEEKFSLKFILTELQRHFPRHTVGFVDYQALQGYLMRGEDINHLLQHDLTLVENLRFFPEEEQDNAAEFSSKLAAMADLFVNEAFSCSHRKHASIVGISRFIPSYLGISFAHEIEMITKCLRMSREEDGSYHFIDSAVSRLAVIGGGKASTKLPLIKSLLKHVDHIYIAGSMLNDFLYGQGKSVGLAKIDTSLQAEVKFLLENKKITLPRDFRVASNIEASSSSIVSEIPLDQVAFDIGPDSIKDLITLVEKSSVVLWNGPLGAYENPEFSRGSIALGKQLALMTEKGKIVSVIGGGDTAAAAKGETFSFVSTGGGAFLEFLRGGALPGVAAIMKSQLYTAG